jgi:hypothetical protein
MSFSNCNDELRTEAQDSKNAQMTQVDFHNQSECGQFYPNAPFSMRLGELLYANLKTRELDGNFRNVDEYLFWTSYGHFVVIRDYEINVYKDTILVWSISQARRIFIGESPSDHHDTVPTENHDGNSILVEIALLRYVFIGHYIIQFSTIDHIRDNAGNNWREYGFVSPVGNSDVPYPYAIDEKGRYYLLLENVRMDDVPADSKHQPYDWYYRRSRITRDLAYIDPDMGRQLVDGNIEHFYLGDDEYSLSYHPEFYTEYNRLTTCFGPLFVKYTGQTQKVKLDQLDYVELMCSFGEEAHFYPMKSHVVLHYQTSSVSNL